MIENDLTIVIVDCVEHMKAQATLQMTSKLTGNDNILMLTDTCMSVNCTLIPKINSLKEYSNFIATQLWKYIETNHVMIIQCDGYPVNVDAWTNLYLQYDYIGAPWVRHLMYDIPGYPKVDSNNIVGNGGFSIRSRDLLEATSELAKEIPVGEFEDCYIARTIRNKLEKKHFEFAPVALALGFSIENQQYSGQYGFHGKRTLKENFDIIQRYQNQHSLSVTSKT